ncbi:MAG: YraN family protein [Cyanobacteria bacterium P01_H01_bin.152]
MTLAKKDLGDRGEALIVAWLQQQGWTVIARQWHCRWGELDIVACQTEPSYCLAFVEVKTRRRGSLDAAGRLAVTPQKQAKLWQTAQRFLSEYPRYADFPCRFDVALVVQTNATRMNQGASLKLLDYIPNAFAMDG